jgi:hypothetical protein
LPPAPSHVGEDAGIGGPLGVFDAVGIADGLPGGRPGVEVAVEASDTAVELLEVLESCLRIVGLLGPQGGDERVSLGFEAPTTEGGAQGERCGRVGLDGEGPRPARSGCPVSIAQVWRRSTDHSRPRSSTAWSRLSATTWT